MKRGTGLVPPSTLNHPSKSRLVMSHSATPWTAARQAVLSIRFPRQESWRGLPFPSSGDLPDPGIEPESPASEADSLPSKPPGKPQVTESSHRKLH